MQRIENIKQTGRQHINYTAGTRSGNISVEWQGIIKKTPAGNLFLSCLNLICRKLESVPNLPTFIFQVYKIENSKQFIAPDIGTA
jgi:hypothetical protein